LGSSCSTLRSATLLRPVVVTVVVTVVVVY
jgi:hypothetical protein